LAEANVSENYGVSIFRDEVLSPPSALKMEAARFSETLASTSQSTRRLNRKNCRQKEALRLFSLKEKVNEFQCPHSDMRNYKPYFA
jgi:hypothetical protein